MAGIKKIIICLWFRGIIFLVLSHNVKGQNADCDFSINVEDETVHYVYSPGYPGLYPPSKNCRWQAKCPVNMRCKLNCSFVSLPETFNCNGDRLLVSITGDSTLTGADKYCGTDPIDITSISNTISIGLITTANSTGGNFRCTLTAVDSDVVVDVRQSGSRTCSCGWKKKTRIVGGVETQINEYPSMVGFIDTGIKILYAGGTIISKRHVLTAAHLFYRKVEKDIRIVYGEHNVETDRETASTIIRARKIIRHPSYKDGNDYDIAVVLTAVDIVFSDRVGPACLPFLHASSTFEGKMVDVLGWGTISHSGMRSDYLQKVQLKVTTKATCTNAWPSVVNSRMICTFTKGKDACQYDSGGPLLWQNPRNGRLYVVGIIAGGYGCGLSKPGFNTRVTSYLKWISSTVKGVELCKI